MVTHIGVILIYYLIAQDEIKNARAISGAIESEGESIVGDDDEANEEQSSSESTENIQTKK